MLGSWATGALEMVPRASKPDAQAATSRDEEIARRAFCAGFPVPRWRASVRLTISSNRSRAPVALCAVASSGLKPSRAFSNRLRPKPTVPVRVLLAVPRGRRARSIAHVDLRPTWGVATNRHARWIDATLIHRVCQTALYRALYSALAMVKLTWPLPLVTRVVRKTLLTPSGRSLR
jgi:hypothetical protein